MATELTAEVTFHLPADADLLDRLSKRARELDGEAGNEPPEAYTLAQALQVCWHLDPEWLHRDVLDGWTLDYTYSEDGKREGVWHD